MIRSDPCYRCGARASCKHREVDDVQLPPLGRRDNVITGNVHSPWGAKGNSAGKARKRILEGLKAQLR